MKMPSHSSGEICEVCKRDPDDPYIYERATLSGKEGRILHFDNLGDDEIWIPQVTEFCDDPIIGIAFPTYCAGVVVPSNIVPCVRYNNTPLYWEGTKAQPEAHLDAINQYLNDGSFYIYMSLE